MRYTLFAILPLLAALAACNTPEPKQPETPEKTAQTPKNGGFAPLRPEVVSVPGQGEWACIPRQDDQPIQCTPAEPATTEAPTRPGLLPISAVGGAPQDDAPATPFVVPDFDAADEIPMSMP